MSNLSLIEIARATGGRVVGRQVLAPGPGHSPKDRSLSIWLSTTSPDGFNVHPHSINDDWQSCRDHVADALGLPRDRWRQAPPPDPLARMQARARQAEAARADEDDRQRRVELAVKIWLETIPAEGTLAETYLASRGLSVPPSGYENLKFHPSGPWGRERMPMMVAAMHDVATGEIRAIHRTALSATGEKIDRRMLGPAGGCAIMLTVAADTLVVGEGVESCLSAIALGYGPGIWAMGSAGSIAGLPVLPDIQHLVLLEERDATSARAVSDCGHRWTRAGKAVSVVLPTSGKDLNDSLRGIA